MIYEMHTDDCTVFGDTNIDFVSRLKQLFEYFREHKLYLKASQCFFGYSVLEFAGIVVSEEGLQTPLTNKQLKSCLDTANYHGDFVGGYSTISQPLHQLLTDHNITRRAVLTPDLTAAFHEMKLSISKCTTTDFMSDIAPITFHTDASDYGVGGYSFQASTSCLR